MTSLSPPARVLALPVPFTPGSPRVFQARPVGGPGAAFSRGTPGSGGAAGSIRQPALLLRGAGCPWIPGAV